MAGEKTYEMLWDCKFCGATKLLGLTHRHCPSCGAPQDQEARYFPSDADKVAVEDHVYVGADRLCPACSEANSAKSNNCRHCGSPLDGSKAAAVRADQVHAHGAFAGDSAQAARGELIPGQRPAPAPAPAPAKKSVVPYVLGCGCLTLLVGVIALAAVFLLWRRDAGLEVTGHHWERTIEVERYGDVTATDWCDEMPAGARETSRRSAQRDTKQVPDGQECKTRKKDQGDGTFKEIEECTPKYRKEAVMADKCTYRIKKWTAHRTAKASGSLKDAPSWPNPELFREGTCDGCERAGKRAETYTVSLKETASGKAHRCELTEAKWRAFSDGATLKGSVSQLTGGLDCGSLTPAK